MNHCWLDMWKSPDMYMHNGRICMESYPEVVYIYICITSGGTFAWYVYVYPYPIESDFKIYISGNKGFGIMDMNFHCSYVLYHYAYLGFRGWQMWRLTHCKEWGKALRHHCQAFYFQGLFHLGVLFICFLFWLWCLVHLLLTLALDFLSATWEFLQVLASIHLSWFYLWLSTSLVLLESSCKFLHQLIHLRILLLAFGISVAWQACIDFLPLLRESFCKLLH